jgi:hypothetical protein
LLDRWLSYAVDQRIEPVCIIWANLSMPHEAKVQHGLVELAQIFSLPTINSRIKMPQKAAELRWPSYQQTSFWIFSPAITASDTPG